MFQAIAIVTLLVLAGCTSKLKKSTTPTASEDIAVWAWETKASVKDIRKNKINQVTIEFVSIKNKNLRLEASATLGYPVGTLVMDSKGFFAVIYPQKKVFKGMLSERTLSRTFNLPIPPNALYSLAYDEPIQGVHWKCTYDGNKWISTCDSGVSKVEWLNRKDGTKLIKITSATIEMNWFFKAPERREYKSELFEVEPPPDDYQVQEIK